MTELEQAVRAEQLRLIEIAKSNLIKNCSCNPDEKYFWSDEYAHDYLCPIRAGGYEMLIELGADLPKRIDQSLIE